MNSTGIWSAALDGDLVRVKSFLKKGTNPNMKDNAGYTALVGYQCLAYNDRLPYLIPC